MQITSFPSVDNKILLINSHALQTKESAATFEPLNVQGSEPEKIQNDPFILALINYQKFNTGLDKSNALFSLHILKQSMAGLDAQLVSAKAYENIEFVNEHNELKTSLWQSLSHSGIAELKSSSKSSNVADQIGDIIGNVKEDYYDIFEGALAKYIQFYKELGEIMASMGSLTTPSDSEGKVKFKFKTLRDALIKLKYNFMGDFNSFQLYPLDVSKNTKTKEDAEKWARDMGLPASSVRTSYDGTEYYVSLDFAPLDVMIDKMIYTNGDPQELTNTEYQAWLTGFNAQEEQIKTTISSLTGRFSNANSIYDNVVKILSSTIGSLADMSKRYFSF